MGDEKAHKMDEQSTVDEVVSLVEEAQKRGKFNLAEVVKGRGYPEKTIEVYTDAKVAYDIHELNEKLQRLSNSGFDEEYIELEKEMKNLGAALMKSKLTFFMRGISQEGIDALTNDAGRKFPDKDEAALEWHKYYVCALVAANIYKVEDSEGNIDERQFTVEDSMELYENLPAEAWGALVRTMEQLTLATGIFKGITDAGFLPKS
jgi:hypothetical protein